MQSTLLPDDVLVAILHQFPTADAPPGTSTDSRKITADRAQLHRAFHSLKKDHPRLFSNFRFRKKDGGLESEALDQALSNLEASGLLHRHNDTPRYYVIQEQLDSAYEKHIQPILTTLQIPDSDLATVARELSSTASGYGEPTVE